MYELRQFQTKLKTDAYRSWDSGNENVILVAPTGSGKTVVMSSISSDMDQPSCAIAHRQELVGQISLAVSNAGVEHNIIASQNVIKFCINQQIHTLGRSFYNPHAPFTVAGVNTIKARANDLVQWSNTIRYWMIDEAHHVLSDNMWGKAVGMFNNARGFGFTASPIRCDRKSLHRSQGGVFDDMVIGPPMRQLIDEGYLSDYRIMVPPQSIDTGVIKISKATGEFSGPSLRQAASESTITGDIVQHYLKFAAGKRGITFTVDVDSAEKTAAKFQAAGVPAEAVSAKTPDHIRASVIEKFVAGKILQLVNVDLFGEGFDVPACEVVSMGRPTESFGLYLQQFGRALRTSEGKTHGLIIDHVGNVKRHGLPDAVRSWSLLNENRGRRIIRDPDVMPVTSCPNCFNAYEAITATCPYCGFKPEPESRGEPKFVDGDLIELSQEALAEMRGAVDSFDAPFNPMTDVPRHLHGTPAAARLAKLRGARSVAQDQLRRSIALWAGVRRDLGMVDSEIYRRFFHSFTVDVMSAQLLGTADATKLDLEINDRMWLK